MSSKSSQLHNAITMQLVKSRLIKRADLTSTLMHYAANPEIFHTAGHIMAGAAGHKAIDYGLGALMRRAPGISNLFSNYYANIAKAGLNAGMGSGPALFPRFRRALGMIMPSVSGITDYEMANTLGSAMKSKGIPQAALGDTARPWLAKGLDKLSNPQSPITRNIINGMTTEKSSPVVDWMQRISGKGPDNQVMTGRLGSVMSLLPSAVFGPAHAVGALMGATAPDVGLTSMANRGAMSTLLKMKSNMLMKGMQFAGKRLPWSSELIGYLGGAPARETMQLGQDLGRMRNFAVEMTAKYPTAVQNPIMGAVDRGVQHLEEHADMPWHRAMGSDVSTLLSKTPMTSKLPGAWDQIANRITGFTRDQLPEYF